MARISRELWQNITKKYRLKKAGDGDDAGVVAIYVGARFCVGEKTEKTNEQKGLMWVRKFSGHLNFSGHSFN
jgi:hypothetical protein